MACPGPYSLYPVASLTCVHSPPHASAAPGEALFILHFPFPLVRSLPVVILWFGLLCSCVLCLIAGGFFCEGGVAGDLYFFIQYRCNGTFFMWVYILYIG